MQYHFRCPQQVECIGRGELFLPLHAYIIIVDLMTQLFFFVRSKKYQQKNTWHHMVFFLQGGETGTILAVLNDNE